MPLDMSVTEVVTFGAEPRSRAFLRAAAPTARCASCSPRSGWSRRRPQTRQRAAGLVAAGSCCWRRRSTASARILILDEPTAAMNAEDCQRVLAVVRRLRERGLAILYISHRFDEVEQLCDRVTVMADGASWTRWRATRDARPPRAGDHRLRGRGRAARRGRPEPAGVRGRPLLVAEPAGLRRRQARRCRPRARRARRDSSASPGCPAPASRSCSAQLAGHPRPARARSPSATAGSPRCRAASGSASASLPASRASASPARAGAGEPSNT